MNVPMPSLAVPNATTTENSSIGSVLLELGKISPESAERVLRMQKELGIRFGEAAIRLGLITEADIQQALARQFDYPYLQEGESKYSEKLVAAYQPFTPQVETLRAVRSQLMLRWFAQGRKSLAIVSLDADDGAGIFAANLAVVFSQLGEQTVLVDGNLRQPSQHQTFDLGSRAGLSDVLAGRATLDAVARINSFVALSVLPAGTLPPNPQELLGREAFSRLNADLQARYDVVLYDAAAFSLGADALPVIARAGGALVVVRKNSSRYNDVAAMVDRITQSGAVIVGTVLVDN
ncbi:chain length determinant protein tyrosine kinase EpsG [Duganella sp. S19_KUP01_CR8]|uniref:chain length determinant protein tyrosine kinase EpsG n=1 Tax=Duganella sp. S19_KUP01_CR8 TaxID=3025502 RepID=UPI002FCDDE0E